MLMLIYADCAHAAHFFFKETFKSFIIYLVSKRTKFEITCNLKSCLRCEITRDSKLCLWYKITYNSILHPR